MRFSSLAIGCLSSMGAQQGDTYPISASSTQPPDAEERSHGALGGADLLCVSAPQALASSHTAKSRKLWF